MSSPRKPHSADALQVLLVFYAVLLLGCVGVTAPVVVAQLF